MCCPVMERRLLWVKSGEFGLVDRSFGGTCRLGIWARIPGAGAVAGVFCGKWWWCYAQWCVSWVCVLCVARSELRDVFVCKVCGVVAV